MHFTMTDRTGHVFFTVLTEFPVSYLSCGNIPMTGNTGPSAPIARPVKQNMASKLPNTMNRIFFMTVLTNAFNTIILIT
jgi:hypothetical protein